MLHVINETAIDIGDIYQIKENVEVKSNRWLSIQTICGSALVHKINPTHATIVKLDSLRAKNWRLGLWTLSTSLNWYTDRLSSIYKPLKPITWKKEHAIFPFYLLIGNHFWHLLSVGSNCSNTISAFLE